MKYIPYATQWIDETDIREVAKTLRSEFLTQGPKVAEFEKKVAAYCDARYAVAVNSGTSALHAACFAAGIGPGDEVITSPITFVASANCVLYCGGRLVFVDVQEDTVNIEPEEVRKNVTLRAKAIIPVHFAGHPADMKEIHKIAREKGLMVIEDACHALGAEYKRTKIGSGRFSDMTVLSFHAVKHIATGEGGMILTNNKEFYHKLLMFRAHGITRDKGKLVNKDQGDWYYEMQHLGFNYRITDFQCALGIKQLTKLKKFISRRREIIKKYNLAFKDIKGLVLPAEKKDVKSSWHMYVIRVGEKRRKIFDFLKAKGIGVNVHYLPVYTQPYYRDSGYGKVNCQNAERYYQEAITLPLYPKMTDREVNYVIDCVKEVIAKIKRPKVGIIVQARMDSTRLPGKVMLPLLGKPVLQKVLERLSYSKTADEIIVATTKKKFDDVIVRLARKLGVKVYRGSEDDVLSRYHGAAKNSGLDIVVRVTSDCPLIDPEVLDRMVERFIELNKKGDRCDYLSNTIARTFPRGLDVEVFSFEALKRAKREAKDKYHREHVTPYINEDPNRFEVRNYKEAEDWSDLRWTLDEESDYRLIQEIYKRLGRTNSEPHYADILELFKRDPSLTQINAHVVQKKT